MVRRGTWSALVRVDGSDTPPEGHVTVCLPGHDFESKRAARQIIIELFDEELVVASQEPGSASS